MIFRTSMDKLTKGITIGFTILFFATNLAVFSFNLEENLLSSSLLLIGLTFMYSLVYIYRPIKYQLTDSFLIIHRNISDVRIERDRIKNIEQIHKDELRYAIRVFGVGGVFGYYGKFRTSKKGMMTWYATRRDRFVLVETVEGKKIILTPDEPEKMIIELNKKV
jgi:hypothetical protein